MKHFSIAAKAAVFLALAGVYGCSGVVSEDFAGPEEVFRSGVTHGKRLDPLQEISARQGNESDTKTVLQDPDSPAILWTEGDAIKVFYRDRAVPFEAATIRGTSATFQGDLGIEPDGNDYVWALYPYQDNASYDGNRVTATLPSVQEATPGSFPEEVFLTLARSKSLSMDFYNICSGVKFSLNRDDVISVTFSGNNGEPLAGAFEVGMDDAGKPVIVSVEQDAPTSVTLSTPDGSCLKSHTWYYLVTLPTKLEKGFTLTLNGATKAGGDPSFTANVISSANFSLNRNHFRKASLIDNRADIPTLSLDIENAKARYYLDHVDYSDDQGNLTTDITGGYTRSDFSKWTSQASLPSGMKGYWPNPVTFTWNPGKERTLKISATGDYSDGATKTYSVSSTAAATQVYNLIPCQTYAYQVLASDGSLLFESTFSPVGPLRMINAGSALKNMRDLGGWVGEGGKTMAYGRLYRGTQVQNGGTSSALSLFDELNITVDLDLRGNGGGSGSNDFNFREVSENDVASASGNLYENIQVYQFMYASGQQPGYTQELYQQALHHVITWLKEDRNIYFHCIGGADRTGTLAFLIEALLGVSENDMSKEYELTSFNDERLRNNSNRPFKQLVFYLKTKPGETLQEKVTNWAMTPVDGSSITPLTDEEIQTLKSIMLK